MHTYQNLWLRLHWIMRQRNAFPHKTFSFGTSSIHLIANTMECKHKHLKQYQKKSRYSSSVISKPQCFPATTRAISFAKCCNRSWKTIGKPSLVSRNRVLRGKLAQVREKAEDLAAHSGTPTRSRRCHVRTTWEAPAGKQQKMIVQIDPCCLPERNTEGNTFWMDKRRGAPFKTIGVPSHDYK